MNQLKYPKVRPLKMQPPVSENTDKACPGKVKRIFDIW